MNVVLVDFVSSSKFFLPFPLSVSSLSPSLTSTFYQIIRYFEHDHALAALRYISGTKLDERLIRADLDPGYSENRQYGRGKAGGQVRDQYRDDFDAGRGGWGHLKTLENIEMERQKEQDEVYRGDHDEGGRGREVPDGGDQVSQV